MSGGDQFKPIEAPYLAQWRERLESKPKPAKPVKVKHKKAKKAKK